MDLPLPDYQSMATSLDALVMSISESSRPCQLPMSTIGIVWTKYYFFLPNYAFQVDHRPRAGHSRHSSDVVSPKKHKFGAGKWFTIPSKWDGIGIVYALGFITSGLLLPLDRLGHNG